MTQSILVKMEDKNFKFLRHTEVKEVVIDNGETVSAEVDLEDYTMMAIMMPAAFTGTAITFQASDVSGGTFYEVMDGAGNAVSLVVSNEEIISITEAKKDALAPLRFLKLVSGSSEGAKRTLKLLLKR